MKIYELTYIVSSQLNPEEIDTLRKGVEFFIQEKEGVILKSEKAVPQTLAYRIKKQSSGYYITLEFQVLEEKVKDIKEKLEKDLKILRYSIVVKKPFKEAKTMRSRSLFLKAHPKTASEYSSDKTGEEKAKVGKVELEEIEKKLDEILSQ